MLLICAALLFIQTQAFAKTPKGNAINKSLNKAKKTLLKEVCHDHLVTFYCGSPFTPQKKVVPSKRYTPKKVGNRAARIEWEHVVPAHAFGKYFTAWTEGDSRCVTRKGKKINGRNCA